LAWSICTISGRWNFFSAYDDMGWVIVEFCGRRRQSMAKRKERHPPNPPPEICTQRVLQYAVLDDSVGFSSGHGLMFVDGKELGRVPCLAICEDTNSSGVMLYYCNRDWNMVGVSGPYVIAAAKKRADRLFPGSLACWIEVHFTQEDAE